MKDHDINEIRQELDATSEQRQRTLDYHKRYNTIHREGMLEKKKKKYANDEEFKAAARKRAAERYQLQKKMRQEIRKATGIQATPARRRLSKARQYCPMCLQPIPRTPKPIFKSVQKKYLVAMFSVREVSRRLGKQVPTVTKWIREDKVLPDTLYKEQRSGTEPTRLWTQDQVEMLMRVFDKYDLRPPVSYHGIGLVKDLRTEWDKLRPFGIDPSKYTVKDEATGFLVRESYELPLPKFASPSEQKEHAKRMKEKLCEQVSQEDH